MWPSLTLVGARRVNMLLFIFNFQLPVFTLCGKDTLCWQDEQNGSEKSFITLIYIMLRKSHWTTWSLGRQDYTTLGLIRFWLGSGRCCSSKVFSIQLGLTCQIEFWKVGFCLRVMAWTWTSLFNCCPEITVKNAMRIRIISKCNYSVQWRLSISQGSQIEPTLDRWSYKLFTA